MKTRLIALFSVTILTASLVTLVSGCAWSVGGSKSHTCSSVPTNSPTRGQELIDLQKAHDTGAISDAEYEKMKQQIMQ